MGPDSVEEVPDGIFFFVDPGEQELDEHHFTRCRSWLSRWAKRLSDGSRDFVLCTPQRRVQ